MSEGQRRIVAGVVRGAAGEDQDGLDRPAIVGERAGLEFVAIGGRAVGVDRSPSPLFR